MSQVSKNQLIYENSTYFPNNNNGAITPADLRAFNVDLIDSTVNQTIYDDEINSLSGRIDGLEIFSASQHEINQTFATTGSNTFNGNQTINGTLSVDAINVTSGTTMSIDSNLYVSGTFSAQLPLGYVWLGGGNGRAQAVPSSSIAAGGTTDISQLNAFTASQQTYNTNNNTKWSTLGSQSGSWITASQTGSFARTNTTNTFTATQTINADLIVSGTINAYKINTTIESSSVIFSSGSNILGDASNDTQTLIGTTRASGSTQITGSLNQTGSSNTLWGETTINNNTIIGNGGTINVAGTITGHGGLDLISPYASINIKSNQEGSGSAFTGVNTSVDTTTDPSNVFAGYQAFDPNTGEGFGMAFNSYGVQYPNTPVAQIFGGGNNPSGDNGAFGFPSNGNLDVWKKSNFAYGVDITGSLRVSGSASVNGSSIVTSNQTGSLVNVPLTSLNSFTQSQQALNATFATTGSNTFNADQYINGSVTLYQPGNPLIYTNILQDALSGQLRFNQAGGNGFWLGSNTQINGNLTNNGNIEIVAPYGSITMKANAQGSGSAYTGINTFVDVTSDPTNVYSAFQFIDDATQNTLIAVALNSYTSQYPGVTIPIIFGGGNNPDANNAGIAFPTSGDMDVWKRTTFAYGTEITGSVRGNVKTQSITSNTASLDFSTSNFFEVTLAASATTRISATNVKPGQTINLKVKQGATTGSISFDSKFKFPAVSPYTASAIANAVDIVTFVTFSDTGSIYSAAVKNMI
jgi:hypothetical protein